MNQEQVEITDVKGLQAAVERGHRLVRIVEAIGQLAGDEHLASGKARFAHGLTDTRLVAVHLGRVDVPVADPQRLRSGVLGQVRRDLEDAESELRDLYAVVQGDGRSIGHVVEATRAPPRAPNLDRRILSP